MQNAKWKVQILEMSTKNTKSRKNFDFCTLQFFRQGRIPLRGTFYNVVFTKSPKATSWIQDVCRKT